MGAMSAEQLEQYKGVFVFAQQVDNKLSNISFELIGEGKRLAEKLNEKVTAVLVGSDVAGLVTDVENLKKIKLNDYGIVQLDKEAKLLKNHINELISMIINGEKLEV